LSDLFVDFTQKYVATVGNDRFIRLYDISTGLDLHQYKSITTDGTINNVAIDPSGMFVAISTTDKRLWIHNFYTGECVAFAIGHAEQITSLMFSSTYRQLISCSSDGCFFVWSLPQLVTKSMLERASEIEEAVVNIQESPTSSRKQSHQEGDDIAQSPGDGNVFIESDWRSLPAWARKQVPIAPSFHG
jgi:WD40 repeat protein